MTSGLIAYFTALAMAALAAPMVAGISGKLGIVDKPDGHRKLHTKPVPLAGGITILVSGILAMGVTVWLKPDLFKSTYGDIRFLASLLAASVLIVAIGLIDDRFGLRGRQKLLGQFLAAMVMVPSGNSAEAAVAIMTAEITPASN